MTNTMSNLPDKPGPACSDFPQVFSSPFLEDFDEVSFLEDQEDAGYEYEEALKMLPQARARHEEIQPRAVQAAKDICASCPLLQECRDWILSVKDQNEVYGVVAGMTLAERKSARRAIARQNSKSLRTRSSVSVPNTVGTTTSQEINETAQRLLRNN